MAHPIIFPVSPDFTAPPAPPAVLTTAQLLMNHMVLTQVREHNREARRVNRVLHLSGHAYLFIPIRHANGSSIGGTFPQTVDSVNAMTGELTCAAQLLYLISNDFRSDKARSILRFLRARKYYLARLCARNQCSPPPQEDLSLHWRA